MFYFLGIILDTYWRAGWYYPTYVLCKKRESTKVRPDLFVHKQDPLKPTNADNLKALFLHPYGNDQIIEYMSDVMVMGNQKKWTHKKNRRAFFPEGYLCYFTCNVYGEPLGQAILIKHVPETRTRRRKTFKDLEEEPVKPLSQRLVFEENTTMLETVKPQFCQHSIS